MAQSQPQFAAPAPTLGPRQPSMRPAMRWRLGTFGFGYLAAFADVVAILSAALAAVVLYTAAFGGGLVGVRAGFDVGLIVAVLLALAGLHGDAYAPARYADSSGQFARTFPLWNAAALAALALGVATREIAQFPRGALALFYVLGHLERAAPEQYQSELPLRKRGPPLQPSLL